MLLGKNFLGIDIGTANIKLVELAGREDKQQLTNYGELETQAFFDEPLRKNEESSLSLSTKDVAQAISAIIKEAKIKTRECIFSIPDFCSFFTNFELPPMTEEEISQAVFYEARQHIPLPLGEVALDWEIIEGEISKKKQTPLKILLVAVPSEVINQYQEIAKLAGLRSLALEAEVFGLIRSLLEKKEERAVAIVDIGAHTSTCSIIEKGILKVSHSFDLSGNDLTQAISRSLSVDYQKAEELKQKYGIMEKSLSLNDVPALSTSKTIKEILLPQIDAMFQEIERICSNYTQLENQEVQKFILAGASSLLPGLKEYFEQYFKKEIEIANPFASISYPLILQQTLKEMGPSYAIAVGMALRGFK